MTAYRTEFFSMNDVNRLRTLQTLSTDASQHNTPCCQLAGDLRQTLQSFARTLPLTLVNRRRGQPNNQQLLQGLAEHALDTIREHNADFGPSLACEKLAEVHNLYLAKETVRKLMTRDSLWIPRNICQRIYRFSPLCGSIQLWTLHPVHASVKYNFLRSETSVALILTPGLWARESKLGLRVTVTLWIIRFVRIAKSPVLHI